MDATPFKGLVPRLCAVETDLMGIRRDLRAAIKAATMEIPPVEPAIAVEAAVPLEPEIPVEAAIPIAPPPAPEPETPRKRGMSAVDVENVLAGRGLHIAGLLLVFLGTAFFLKVAFDHNWIVPMFRVALGMAAGAGLIAYAQRLVKTGNVYFAEGITALGAGIEFLSLYAAGAMFHLASPVLVFGGMIAVTAAISALAWRHRSERLGILAAAGGFLTPLLAGTATSDPWMVAGYLGVLDAGLLILAELIGSRAIAPIALFGSVAVAVDSFALNDALSDVHRAIVYAALYAVYAGAAWSAAKLRGSRDRFLSVVDGVALGCLVIGLESALNAEHRTLLAGILLGVTLAHLGAATLLKSRYQSWFASVTLALSILAGFERVAIVNVAWAAEAAVLVIAGARFRDTVAQVLGLSLLGIDLLRIPTFSDTYAQTTPVLNDRFVSWAAAFASSFAMARALDVFKASQGGAILARSLRTASHAIALIALSTEAWTAVQYYGGTQQASSAALSVVWATVAAVLIASGLIKRDAFVRWEGLGLISVTAAKVLLIDLSFLDLGYRVISAVLVGIALIGVSYAYQRRLRGERAAA